MEVHFNTANIKLNNYISYSERRSVSVHLKYTFKIKYRSGPHVSTMEMGTATNGIFILH